jgi:hypothetical protein
MEKGRWREGEGGGGRVPLSAPKKLAGSIVFIHLHLNQKSGHNQKKGGGEIERERKGYCIETLYLFV